MGHKYLPEKDFCTHCVKKVAKWGAILYIVHWTLHIVAFVVSPTLGAFLLALF